MAGIVLRYNDIGTPLPMKVYRADGELETDLVSADTLTMYFYPPSGSANIISRNALATVPGSTAEMYYTSQDGDFEEVGVWYWQAYIKIGTGEWRTGVKTFIVEENIETLDPPLALD